MRMYKHDDGEWKQYIFFNPDKYVRTSLCLTRLSFVTSMRVSHPLRATLFVSFLSASTSSAALGLIPLLSPRSTSSRARANHAPWLAALLCNIFAQLTHPIIHTPSSVMVCALHQVHAQPRGGQRPIQPDRDGVERGPGLGHPRPRRQPLRHEDCPRGGTQSTRILRECLSVWSLHDQRASAMPAQRESQ